MAEFIAYLKKYSKHVETKKIEKNVSDAKNVTEFLKVNEIHDVDLPKCHEVIEKYMTFKGLKKSLVIKKSHLYKSYAYGVMDGTKKAPSRDCIICFAFGLGMNLADTQFLLQCSIFAPLNYKSPRDRTFIYGIEKALDLVSVNIILDQQGLELLNLH